MGLVEVGGNREEVAARKFLAALRVEDDAALALYYQIKQRIKQGVEMGRLPRGVLLPSERELCEMYGVSRPTVRQAAQELINEGLLERRRGVGTFVAGPKIPQRLLSVQGFTERMERAGRRPGTRVMERDAQPARAFGSDVEQALQATSEERVLRAVRLRFADGLPVLLETTHLSLERLPGLESEDLQNQSLYRTLRDRYGVEINHLRETIEPVVLGPQDAELLQMRSGGAGAKVQITTYDPSERPVEYTLAVVRGDQFQYQLEFKVDARQGNGRTYLQQTQLEVTLPAQEST